MIRPGTIRLNSSRVAKNAACGPPKPIGTPNLCELPIAISAPISAGVFRIVKAKISQAIIVSTPLSLALVISLVKSRTSPFVPGYCISVAKQSLKSLFVISATTSSIPSGLARVCKIVIVCGCVFTSTKNLLDLFLRLARLAIIIASAAAVGSSSKEALEISIPVRSIIICWKLSNISNRP